MGRCILFCAAEFDGLLEPVRAGDYVIAADGGLLHTERLGITPDEILGDFDSLGRIPAGSRVFPVEKDDTDAMLAVRRGLALGYREFYLYGSLDGPRLDHTVANFQTLQFLADRGSRGYLVGIRQIVTVVKNGAIRFPAGREGNISLFCMGSNAEGVDILRLHYPLRNGTLTPGFPLGVSNQFVEKEATLSVAEGRLLVLWDLQNGLPIRN